MRAAANGEPQWSGRIGRPSKYRPEFDRIARDLCMLGFTNKQIASTLGVTHHTLEDWEDNIESFSNSIREGRELADARVAASLYHRAIGYSHPTEHIVTVSEGGGVSRVERVPITKQYPPDTAAAFIWLKNRRRELWRDDPLGLAHLPPEQQARAVQEAIRAANAVAALPPPESQPNDDDGEEAAAA